MKRTICYCFFIIQVIIGQAQTISVSSFKLLDTDITANTAGTMELDQNGETSALIKVVTTQTGFTFDGGALGIVKTKQTPGEVWVYIPRGAKKITIKHPQLGVLRDFYYPITIEAARTYEMVLVSGEVHTIVKDWGYSQESHTIKDNGSNSMRNLYLNSLPYYKDAANMGLRGRVKEVITENPIMEKEILHFDETGKLLDDVLVNRRYNDQGYLLSAAMTEQNGGNSHLIYEYNSDSCLVKRTLLNPSTGIQTVNDYRYNTSFEITQQSQKAFNSENECILSITMKNDFSERDDTGNWTVNKAQLTYWEKGQRTQIIQVQQTRVISYWDE